MKAIKFLSGLAVSLSFVSASAFADTLLTQVTNDYTATNSCSVSSIAGGGGGSSYYTIFRVTCGSEIAYVEKTTSNYGYCTMKSTTSAFRTSSTCGNYSLYKVTASSVQSSSSVATSPVTITRVVNDVSDIGCAVQSVAGGNNYVVYTINCPGYSNLAVQKTYSNGSCSISPASGGITVTGACNDYRVKK